MDYIHLPRKIENPYWGNQEKTQVICEFNYEGGPVVTAAVSNTDDGNPDWKEIFEIWSQEQLDELTQKILDDENELKAKQKEAELDELERMKIANPKCIKQLNDFLEEMTSMKFDKVIDIGCGGCQVSRDVFS